MSLKDTLKASFESIIEALDKVEEAPPVQPQAPSVQIDDEESEFRARFEAEKQEEQDEQFRARLLAEKKQVASKAERFLSEIRTWQNEITERVQKIETAPAPVVPAPVVQTIIAPTRPKNWTLAVTSRENGLMSTLLATAQGETSVEFTIRRTPDGYPKSIEAKPQAVQ